MVLIWPVKVGVVTAQFSMSQYEMQLKDGAYQHPFLASPVPNKNWVPGPPSWRIAHITVTVCTTVYATYATPCTCP